MSYEKTGMMAYQVILALLALEVIKPEKLLAEAAQIEQYAHAITGDRLGKFLADAQDSGRPKGDDLSIGYSLLLYLGKFHFKLPEMIRESLDTFAETAQVTKGDLAEFLAIFETELAGA